MSQLLVIDDEQGIQYSFREAFEDNEVKVRTAGTAAEGLELFRTLRPDVVILDLQLPDGSGLEVFQQIRALDAKQLVIFITAHGTTDAAIAAMKHGAFDYLVKPLDLERLSQIVARALETARLMSVPALLPVEETGDRLVGRSQVMQEMCKALGQIAPQDVNVLILGESGTGKELVARALYQHSRRAAGPFLAINCAAIPETLLESELFGHEQGAFTGAHRRRIGKFEQSHGGTLFLDEIGDMTPPIQAKMLRVLQEQRFERVGGNETLNTNVRILAATNQDLESLVSAGTFRKDLYYRLCGVSVRVPPLRERLEDVAEIAHYFLYRFNQAMGKDVRAFAPETLDLFQAYSWPGNVREMQSVVREALLRSSGHVIFPEVLPEALRRQAAVVRPALSGCDLNALVEAYLRNGDTNLYAQTLEAVERVLLPRVLRHTQGNQTQASELLGLSRNTLRQRLRALGIESDKGSG
jgi:two-component system nitrogen regulation response regulator GlnG